ncbi:O-antigen ligase-related [Candidatus Nanopelagicaceae bacterium]
MRTPESLAIGRLLGWTALLATVTVMPWAAYDPINVPKLAVISVGGFMALGALLANRAEFIKSQYRLVLIFGLAFIIDLTIVLLVSGTNFYQEFFGTFGRATGYVAYVALASLLMVAAVTASTFALKRFIWSLLGAGLISIVYGIIQALNLDPINWVNQYTPVIGFLGNPNFQSSFVGFSGVMAFAMLLGKEGKAAWRAGYVAYVVAAAYVIKETASQQGFLVLLGGIAVVVFIWISRSKIRFLTIPSLVLGLAGVVLVTLGSLNKGPLASVLYKASVTYRGDYWRAGWKMTTEHPFFGVGLDSYGDWYRRARTVEATLRRGPDIVSNAAHNVLLDLSSNGGLPLLAIYLFMMFLVVSAAVKVVKRIAGFDPVFSGLVAVWIAYQAQSIISLNQLGLAVWGWIISGLIIGYEINTREAEVAQKQALKGKSASAMAAQKVLPATAVGIFVGLIVGIALGMPTLNTASKYKSGLETGDAATVQKIASIWPQDASRSAQIALILNENKLPDQALAVVQEAKGKFSDSYDVWKVLASLPNAPADDIAAAKAQMKRLDPHNPDLK